MPSKRKRSRPAPPPDDPSVTRYKLFASSKRSNSIKVKGRIEPKMEGRRRSSASSSSQQNRVTNSQFSVVISDSESDSEGEGVDKEYSIIAKEAGPSRNKIRVIEDDDDEIDDDMSHDNVDDVEGSDSSSSKRFRSDNQAKSSRGMVTGNSQPSSNGHVSKVASFKPLPKHTSHTSTSKGGESVQKHGSTEKGKGREETPHRTEKMIKTSESAKKAKNTMDMFRGISDSESEEFHEPIEFRRSSVPRRSSSGLDQNGVAEGILGSNKRKATENGDDDEKGGESDEDDDHIDSVLGHAIPSSVASSNPEESNDYVTREELERAVQSMREEMKQEMERLKSALRSETEQLIRQ